MCFANVSLVVEPSRAGISSVIIPGRLGLVRNTNSWLLKPFHIWRQFESYLPNKVVSRCLRHSVHLLTLLAPCLWQHGLFTRTILERTFTSCGTYLNVEDWFNFFHLIWAEFATILSKNWFHLPKLSYPVCHHCIYDVRRPLPFYEDRYSVTGPYINHMQNPAPLPLFQIHRNCLIEFMGHWQAYNWARRSFCVTFA